MGLVEQLPPLDKGKRCPQINPETIISTVREKMPQNPYNWLDRSLSTIHRASWYRSVQTLSGRPGSIITLDGEKLINFASNDYLGLAGDDRLINAAISATKELGTGTTGSLLLTGHRQLHRQLEIAIASLKQTERCFNI